MFDLGCQGFRSSSTLACGFGAARLLLAPLFGPFAGPAAVRCPLWGCCTLFKLYITMRSLASSGAGFLNYPQYVLNSQGFFTSADVSRTLHFSVPRCKIDAGVDRKPSWHGGATWERRRQFEEIRRKNMRGVHKWGYHKMDGFLREILFQWMMTGSTPIYGNPHM